MKNQSLKLVFRSSGFFYDLLRRFYHLFDPVFPKTPFLVQAKIRGVKYLLWLNENSGRRFFLSRRYETDDLRALSQLIKPGDICLDVGANAGIYTLAMASATGLGGAVYAFEPILRNARLVGLAAEINGFRNVKVMREVVSDTTGGKFSCHLPLEDSGHAYFHPETADTDDVFDTITIDDFAKREKLARIDVIKVDVEGAEARVLKGARQVLSGPNPPRVIQVEVVQEYMRRYEDTVGDLFAELQAMGYHGFSADGSGGLSPYERGRYYASSNIFFVHTGVKPRQEPLPGADRILVYSRPAWQEWWWCLAEKAFPGSVLMGVSEYRHASDYWLMESVYDRDDASTDALPFPPVSREETIRRCRVLRNLPEERAVRLIKAVWAAIEELLDEARPNAVLSIAVDSYVLDLMACCCERRGVAFLSLVNFPFNGYSRITRFGEHVAVREPEDGETQKILAQVMKDDYRPSYALFGRKQHIIWKHIRRALYYKIKSVVYWSQKRFDPLNYEYMSLPFVADRRRLRDILHLWHFDRNWKARWRKHGKPAAYMPLHLTPEATVDYWVPNLDFAVEYEDTVIEAARILAEKFTVLVKEHPVALGTRTHRFYRTLKAIRGVVLVPSEAQSIPIIKEAALVVTWTGTSGFEAALRDKPVAVLGRPYYSLPGLFMEIDTLDDLRRLEPDRLRKPSDVRPDFAEAAVDHMLRCSLVGSFLQYGYDTEDNARRLAESLQTAWPVWRKTIVPQGANEDTPALRQAAS